jgi:curved DNA-binding protein CbpA
MVRLHHPDHNGGSLESARRFEAVQEAYTRIRELRKHAAPPPPPRTAHDPGIDDRLRDIEGELREAQRARQEAERARAQARREAREAAQSRPGRATDEELGYVTTDDSLSKIVSDVWDELTDRFSEAREHPAVKRVEDLIDELDPRHQARE